MDVVSFVPLYGIAFQGVFITRVRFYFLFIFSNGCLFATFHSLKSLGNVGE